MPPASGWHRHSEQKKAPWRSRGFLIGKLLGLDWGLRASAIARAILRIRRDGPRLDLPGAGAQRPQAAVTSRFELPHKSLCIWLDQPPFPCNLTVSPAAVVSQEPAIPPH